MAPYLQSIHPGSADAESDNPFPLAVLLFFSSPQASAAQNSSCQLAEESLAVDVESVLD
jgi:hypothetical protein